jgi:hypothetical protein
VKSSLRHFCLNQKGVLFIAILFVAQAVQAQISGWTTLIVGDPTIPSFFNVIRPPILGSPFSTGSSSIPPPWTGALSSAPPNLGSVLGGASDGAGNVYTLYSSTSLVGFTLDPQFPYYGYVSKRTPTQGTGYFGLTFLPSPAGLAVDVAGDVFILENSTPIQTGAGIFQLKPDGSVVVVGIIPFVSSKVHIVGGMSVDGSGNVSVPITTSFLGFTSQLTYLLEAFGPIPNFAAPLPTPSYVSPNIPPTSVLTVPFSPNPTVSLSINEATSTLPPTYQWYFNNIAVSGATLTTYNGPFTGPGIYSVTASTSAGSVTSSTTVSLTIGGMAASAAPALISYPVDTSIPLGANLALTAAAGATLPVSFQWFFNGAAIPGANSSVASSATYGVYTTSYTVNQPGIYTVVATSVGSGGGSATSPPATLTVKTSGGAPVQQSPTILSQPQSAAFTYGRIPVLSAVAVATLPITYQWQLNGADISGATTASYSSAVQGTYTLVVKTSAGAVTSAPAVVALANRPVNISGRAMIGTGDNTGIAGFIISSYSGATKRVLIRAVGPALATLNVAGALAHPVLTVADGAGRTIATNSGWNNSPAISAASLAAGAFAFPAGSADSALILDLAPGSYTALVSGANASTGIALIEVYEISADSGHLVNISTRASVGTGPNILIGGFVVGGTQPSQVLIRAIGPGLKQFGVPGFLAQPVLSLYDSTGKLIAVNVGWSNGTSADAVALANAATTTGAFPLQAGSADSAVLVTLAPGAYTAQVTGINDSTGVGLVEVYQVPQ